MHPLPILLKQSLRSSVNLAKVSSYPGRTQFPPAAAVPKAFNYHQRAARSFSICCHCQFRSRYASLYEADKDRLKDVKDSQSQSQSQSHPDLGPAPPVPEGIPKPEDLDVDSQQQKRDGSADGWKGAESVRLDVDGHQQHQQQQEGQQAAFEPPGRTEKEQEEKDDRIYDPNMDAESSGRLPSSLESRRSHFSKKFSSLMDDLQSNIFVAGQHLNDLTGYSSIEALKREIQEQEARVRESRARVRRTKEAYASAINRRSTSQREVNDLLQRKHTWSPLDLERFTSLYRNDHTNEVSEAETQHALTAAEQEAEEAAAQLSKCILSRYHEEQVWSDKIRRMSTWGTWGLMGVNVLLFLVFQIAVEPWRRRRLVTGFEEKVVEALEKEKALHEEEKTAATASTSTTTETAAEENQTSASTLPNDDDFIIIDDVPIITDDASTSDPDALISEKGFATATVKKKRIPTTSPRAAAVDNKVHQILEYCKSQLSRFRHPPALDISLNYLQDCFSDYCIVVSKRDVTNAAIQGVAAGAAITGFVIALIRTL